MFIRHRRTFRPAEKIDQTLRSHGTAQFFALAIFATFFFQIGNSVWTSVIINMTKNCEKSQLTRKIVRLAIFRNFRNSLSKNRQPSDFYNFSLTPENRNFYSCVKIVDISVLILTFVNDFTIFLCAERYLSKYKMASPNLVLRVRKGRDRASPS